MEKEEKKLSVITMLGVVFIALAICVAAYFLITQSYVKNELKGNVKEEISNEAIYSLEQFPKIDGSTSTQPLIQAVMKNFTAQEKIDFSKYNFTKTHQAYVKLINDEVDLIVVTSPSEEELELAKKKGIELEVIPVVKEGFVFYVNSENKVENITTEQVQNIYTGSIKNWNEVGGEDAKIVPYQRPVNSGSQTGMLDLVMKDKKIMKAPKENLAASMSAIINFVSSYDNGKDSIGYSYYYYATTMYESIDSEVASRIKLLSIDGVQPNVKTIQNGTYPFTTAYYIVINKADGEGTPARTLANQMLSQRGQKVALDAGYVPVK